MSFTVRALLLAVTVLASALAVNAKAPKAGDVVPAAEATREKSTKELVEWLQKSNLQSFVPVPRQLLATNTQKVHVCHRCL